MTAISKLFAAFKVIKRVSQFIYPKSTSDPLRGPRSRVGTEMSCDFAEHTADDWPLPVSC